MNAKMEKMIQKLPLLIILIFLTIISHSRTGNADESRHEIWKKLLHTHVEKGAVDYIGFKQQEEILDEYLKVLGNINLEPLSHNEQLALYINAYNAYTVKLILMNFINRGPVSSIKKIGGFFAGPWDIQFVSVGGEKYSLDNIEHDIIRPKFKDPRVHFAINCASKSCPPLLKTPFEANMLDLQLTRVTEAFVNDPRSNYFQNGTLYVSKIFKWFHEDFNNNITSFIMKYAKGDLKKNLSSHSGEIQIKYLNYDWSINRR